MSNSTISHSFSRHIDSFQKLRFLLFLHHHPNLQGTSQELAERSFLGHTPLFEILITELNHAGLVERIGNHYKLPEHPEVKLFLQGLARLFEDPLTRQKMIEQFNRKTSLSSQPARPKDLFALA